MIFIIHYYSFQNRFLIQEGPVILSHVLNDTMRIQKVISDIIGVYAIDILILIITIIVLFYYSLVSAILSLICLPVLYLIVNKWNSRIISAQHNLMAGYASSESNFINSLGGIQEIKSMNWQEIFFKEK